MVDDIHDMNHGRSSGEHGRGDDGGLTEAIAAAHGNDAEDADCQVGEANLELERITGRPADGFRN